LRPQAVEVDRVFDGFYLSLKTWGPGKVPMQTYYFDLKDGVPVRDRSGLEFVSDGAAIAHCKRMAEEVRDKEPKGNLDLKIVVIDESGREIHREQIYLE
jgi:hypothetical protein